MNGNIIKEMMDKKRNMHGEVSVRRYFIRQEMV